MAQTPNIVAAKSPHVSPHGRGAFDVLKHDRWLWAGGIAMLGCLALYLLPLGESTHIFLTVRFAPAVFLGLATAAFIHARRRNAERVDGPFWWIMSWGLGLWLGLVVLLLATGLDTATESRLGLLSDITYSAYYLLVILAVEIKPHRADRGASTRRMEWLLSIPGAVIFVGGLLVYFSIATGPTAGDSFLASFLLYASIDGYLALRLSLLARRSRLLRWRWVYGLMAAAYGFFLFTDLFEGWRSLPNSFEWSWASPLNVMWNVPFIVLLMAARLGASSIRSPRAAATSTAQGGQPRARGAMGAAAPEPPAVSHLPSRPLPTVAWALLLPLLHWLFYRLDLLDPTVRTTRQGLALAMVGVLGSYALFQRHMLSRRSLQLWHERREIERQLLESEEDLRLMLARQHTQAEIEHSEQLFYGAFHASPDAMVLSTWEDGEVIDCNRSFENLFGYGPLESIDSAQLASEVWPSRAARQRMLDVVRSRGSVRDHPTRFTTRDGRRLRLSVSFETLYADGQRLLLSVARDLTAHLGFLDVVDRAAVAETAHDALIWLEADGSVRYANEPGRRLLESVTIDEIDRQVLRIARGESHSASIVQLLDRPWQWWRVALAIDHGSDAATRSKAGSLLLGSPRGRS